MVVAGDGGDTVNALAAKILMMEAKQHDSHQLCDAMQKSLEELRVRVEEVAGHAATTEAHLVKEIQDFRLIVESQEPCSAAVDVQSIARMAATAAAISASKELKRPKPTHEGDEQDLEAKIFAMVRKAAQEEHIKAEDFTSNLRARVENLEMAVQGLLRAVPEARESASPAPELILNLPPRSDVPSRSSSPCRRTSPGLASRTLPAPGSADALIRRQQSQPGSVPKEGGHIQQQGDRIAVIGPLADGLISSGSISPIDSTSKCRLGTRHTICSRSSLNRGSQSPSCSGSGKWLTAAGTCGSSAGTPFAPPPVARGQRPQSAESAEENGLASQVRRPPLQPQRSAGAVPSGATASGGVLFTAKPQRMQERVSAAGGGDLAAGCTASRAQSPLSALKRPTGGCVVASEAASLASVASANMASASAAGSSALGSSTRPVSSSPPRCFVRREMQTQKVIV